MMKIVSGLFVVFALIAAPAAFAEGDPAAGKAKSTACAACHNADGNSTIAIYPRIAGLGEKYLLKQLQEIQSGARAVPEMVGQLDNFNEQDLADLAAYFSAQALQPAGAKEENLALGERIYRGGNMEIGIPACTGCHSPSGNGNAPAGYPALGGQFADYIAKQLRAFRTGAHDPEDPAARTNDGDAEVMRGVAARMSDQEIDAVANFIAGLDGP